MGIDADGIPDPIHWHEGLLLTPQHFQQLSLRQEALLQYSTSMIAPFYWGIRHIKIEEPSLFRGLVQIKHLEAVMPDGLVIHHRDSDELQVDLNKCDGAKQKRMKVYLTVPRQSRQMSKGEHARYNSYEGDEVADEFSGEGNVRILRLAPRLMLIVADTPPPKVVSFPLLEVEFKNDSFVQTDFIPPLLGVTSRAQLGAQSQLGIECERIVKLVRDKAQELVSQAESQSSDGAIRLDLETKSWIRSLTAGLPQLEAMLGTEVAHPYPLFLALCSMAGHLAALGAKLIPDRPSYNHFDLRTSFQPVIKFIEQAIQQGLSSSYKPYLFSYADGFYEREFDGNWLTRRLILGLRAQHGVSKAELIKWGDECLIGSRRLLKSMREKRILGAGRKHIEGDSDLVASKDVVLFLLKADPDFIEGDEVLQIFNRGEQGQGVRPVEIVLYVKNAEHDRG